MRNGAGVFFLLLVSLTIEALHKTFSQYMQSIPPGEFAVAIHAYLILILRRKSRAVERNGSQPFWLLSDAILPRCSLVPASFLPSCCNKPRYAARSRTRIAVGFDYAAK